MVSVRNVQKATLTNPVDIIIAFLEIEVKGDFGHVTVTRMALLPALESMDVPIVHSNQCK